MEKLIPTINEGSKTAAEDSVLQLTIAFAPFDVVMPAVVGLFRANYGYSRQIDDCDERQWARLDRLGRLPEETPVSLDSVRILEPQDAPDATIIEDYFGTDHDQLATLLPDVNFLHIYSEYCRKSAERHCYRWRQGGEIKRHVYFHHNYQFPGWDWEEEGERQPWEDTERMNKKRVSARCDRALMLDYSKRLGCELHGPLANNAWHRCILVHQIPDTDASELPHPTKLGENFRKQAVSLGFGQGEEGISFRGHIEDAKFFWCNRAHHAVVSEAIKKTRSAKTLLEVMKTRGTAPDWQDEYSGDKWLWDEALRHAYRRFPDKPELAALENLAKSETKNHRFPTNDLQLRNLKACALGKPLEDDPDMLEQVFRDTPFAL